MPKHATNGSFDIRASHLRHLLVYLYGVWHKPYTTMPPRFPLEINPTLGVPIYRQIVDGIREMIAAGQLHPGDQLPSIRELARELRINPSSCVKAYNHLRDAALIEGDQGRGTFVAAQPNLAAENRNALLERDLHALLARARARGSSDAAVLAALKALIDQRKESS
jgi:GntR family transcriptional regulator